MLTQLYIENIAVVEKLEITFKSGMTTLTGETGAGKSILIDSLNLISGGRVNSNIVRTGANKAQISAIFNITNNKSAISFLIVNELIEDDKDNNNLECIIRRVIDNSGKSKAFINGHPVTLSQLKELTEHLIDIHAQHQHHTLLKPEQHQILLDEFASHPDLLKEVKNSYLNYKKLKDEFKHLKEIAKNIDKLELMKYQLEELNQLSLGEKELQDLDLEHKELANAHEIIDRCSSALECISSDSDNDVTTILNKSLSKLNELAKINPKLKQPCETLNQVVELLDEVHNEIDIVINSTNIDPERLNEIENRLNQIYTLARKHRVEPQNLMNHHHELQEQFDNINNSFEKYNNLEQEIQKSINIYLEHALVLSESRKKAALVLEKQIIKVIKQLEMPNGIIKLQFKEQIDCTNDKQNEVNNIIPKINGIDNIEFLVSTNPGQALQELRKVASGGELSRISLAIEVVSAKKAVIPTLVFDEVDVGISGKTAEIVGKLLRELGKNAQVLCVTHQPQVAAKGHHHYKVIKQQNKNHTTSSITTLSDNERVNEVARLLAGIEISEHAISHAKTMIDFSEN